MPTIILFIYHFLSNSYSSRAYCWAGDLSKANHRHGLVSITESRYSFRPKVTPHTMPPCERRNCLWYTLVITIIWWLASRYSFAIKYPQCVFSQPRGWSIRPINITLVRRCCCSQEAAESCRYGKCGQKRTPPEPTCTPWGITLGRAVCKRKNHRTRYSGTYSHCIHRMLKSTDSHTHAEYAAVPLCLHNVCL